MTNKEATLGLIMPNYNHAEFLEKAFSEIRSQAPYPQQFVVIDDGSTDQSRELIKKWEAESAANQAVYLPKNTGVNEATKSGLEQVTTDFFCPRSVDGKPGRCLRPIRKRGWFAVGP